METLPTVSSLVLCLLLSSLLPSSSAACNDEIFSGRSFQSCESLSSLDATIHWTYFPSNGSAAVAFRVETAGWAAWGINPTGRGMIGTQALVAYQNGSSTAAFGASLTTKLMGSLRPSTISVNTTGLTGEYRNGKITIFATIVLPNNTTEVNHTWQKSDVIAGGYPGPHPIGGEHASSVGTLNFLSSAPSPGGGDSGTPATPSPTRSPPASNDGAARRAAGGLGSLLLLAVALALW
ncbi:unnamed protein product [Spirodela intermedia]|uniref:DOMON domain-containing protein n=1 Tax=Spirodela intermedia TaxID=51605 RepID=A0A7I8L2C0_SPIIN|nr:unnamed protein product [Spirodela intermedia]